MTKYTLDTNCIYDVEQERPNAPFIRKLLAQHAAGTASVAVVAISASERQKGGEPIKDFGAFREYLSRIGLGEVEILKPLAYWEIAFWDWALWGSPEAEALEKSLHDIMFPESPFLLADCEAAASDPTAAKRKWTNRKCDVQALWSHIHAGRDVFVTRDSVFHQETKKPRLIALGVGQILLPQEAAALVASAAASAQAPDDAASQPPRF